MTDFFYFDQNSQKHGPVSEQQLKELAEQGVIGPNTPMETAEGHKGIAKQIPGLRFAASAASSSTVPEWYVWVAMTCGIVCLVLAFAALSGERQVQLLIKQDYEHNYELVRAQIRSNFWIHRLFEIVFVAGMFFGCRGMSTNKAEIATIGLILCMITFVLVHFFSGTWE